MELAHSQLLAEEKQSVRKRKKILFFLNNFQIGGAHLQMVYLIREIKKANFDPVICTHLNNEGGLKNEYLALGVKIYTLSRRNFFDLSILRKLKHVLVSEQVDTIVLMMPHSLVYYHLVKPFIRREIQQVGLLRAMGFWLGHKNAFFKIIDDLLCARLIKTSDLVIANSYAVKNKYDQQLKLPKEMIKVVYNSSEFSFRISKTEEEIRNELNIDLSNVLVIMVARLDPWKDFDTFLKAAKDVSEKEKSFRFIICGGGSLEDELKKKIAELNLSGVVQLLGERKNVHDYINASDISVLTTKGEGFSNVIMESMALGKPVVATNVGGNSELLGTEGKYGFLIENKDCRSLANILLRLFKSKEQMREIGRRAKERIQDLCEKNKNTGIIIKYLDSLP